MSETTKATTTRSEGWQKTCRHWAEARESFELLNVGPGHLAFCKQLCDDFGYECRYESHSDMRAVFVPLG